ncbi:MAG: hypothetical protein QGG64_14605 [Candidatus Latescibacteria bacterium]|nr:hypothetical protein [Candidatus Latescibacterota bacterium]
MAVSSDNINESQPAIDTARSPWWAIALAVFITVAMNAVIPYTHHYMHTISLVEGMIPMGIFMPFLVLIFIVNPLLRMLGCSLQPWELIFIFAVGYVSMHINELLGRVLATYAVMNYMATPENLWEEFVFDMVKPWLVVEDADERLAWFYEGLPRNATIPWDIWLRPTFWWLSFISAIGIGCVALAAILRRQWVEQERLPFPFAQVAEELAETAGPKGFPEYMKQPLFWAGFSIPSFIVLWYIIGYFDSSFPVITVGIQNYNIPLGRYVPSLHGRLNFLIVGFAYFTDLQVLFSIWVFWLLTWFQIGFTNRLGLADGLGEFAGTRQQALGGFIVFCLWGLWIARTHLKAVFQQAFRKTEGVDDRKELMSYRVAVFAFIACVLYMTLWLFNGGMSPIWALLVTLFWFIFYTGFAKIVAMTGLVFLESPSSLGTGIMGFAPPDSLPPGTIAVRQQVGSLYQNGKSFTMPGASHAARLGVGLGDRARMLGLTIVFAFVFSLIVAVISTIYLGYQDGAFNFGSYMFRVAAPRYYDGIVSSIRDIGKETHYGLRMGFTAFGALVMGVLTLCQYRFTWWPLHPIGFTVVTFYSARTAIVSVFLTWLVKFVILRLGGIGLYRKAKPFFIGMIVGYTLSLVVSMGVDLIWFPGRGHNLFWGD